MVCGRKLLSVQKPDKRYGVYVNKTKQLAQSYMAPLVMVIDQAEAEVFPV